MRTSKRLSILTLLIIVIFAGCKENEELMEIDEVSVLEITFDDVIYQLREVQEDTFRIIANDHMEYLVYEVQHIDDYTFLKEMEVSDLDNDKLPEIYLKYEDSTGTSKTLLLNHPKYSGEKGKLFTESCFYEGEITYDTFMDKKVVLLEYHIDAPPPCYEEFKMISAYNIEEKAYIYSFDLTRRYYEENMETRYDVMLSNMTPENWTVYLESQALLGELDSCNELIENAESLEEFDVNPDWDGPYDSYFKYIIQKATFYQGIWNELNPYSVLELDKDELNLSNGLIVGMTYVEFQNQFHFLDNLSLENSEEAFVLYDEVHLTFRKEKNSEPVLKSYIVYNPEVKTSSDIGIGSTTKELMEVYGLPHERESKYVVYIVEKCRLYFEMVDDRVIAFEIKDYE